MQSVKNEVLKGKSTKFCAFTFLLTIFLLFVSPAFALDAVTNLVGNAAVSEKIGLGSYLSGDSWIRFDELDYLSADFNFYFEKTSSKINVAQLKLMVPETDIIVGRQQIGWGVGFTINPMDIFNTTPISSSFDPTFVRDGRDSINLTRYFGNNTKLELIYAGRFGEASKKFEPDLGIKLKSNLADFDLALMYVDKGWRRFGVVVESRDRVVGFEMKGSIPVYDWGLWTEVARYVDARKTELVLGTDYYFDNYQFILEYYRNGFGAGNIAAYDATLLLRGRLMGQDYLIPILVCALHEKLTLTSYGVLNLNDSSFAFGGVVDYFINDNLEFIVMPFMVVGDAASEYGLQKASYGYYGAMAKLKCFF